MPRIGNVLFIALLTPGISGCRKPAEVTFTKWATQESRVSNSENSESNRLMATGNTVEQQAKLTAKPDAKGRLAAPITTRTNFFPKQKTEARKVIGNSRAEALSAAQKIKTINYVPTGLALPPPYLSGLRLIGSSIIWDIEDAIHNHDYDKAIVACGSATTLGNSLMSGGANEASLGASLINQARQKMVPILGSLSGFQLGKLGSAIQKASSNRPPIYIAIQNEKDNMLLCLQQAQDLFETKKLDQLQERIGLSTKDSIDLLKGFEKEPEKAKALFDSIGNDIVARSDFYLKLVKNPQMSGLPPNKDEKKSKLMLFRYFSSNLESLVPMMRTTYCRTQLFILECYLKQKMKFQKPLPPSLSAFSESATIDPFTGEKFYYKAGQLSYLLYSAGEDLVDDGGKTDSSFRDPDLLLEKPHS
ncbi:MAG: hypothetical protein WCI55_05780 [Armatimonadota bacterium]